MKKIRPTIKQYHDAIRENLTPGVTLEDVLSRSRKRPIIEVRRAAWRKLRALGGSYPGIASVVGYDHSDISEVCNYKPRNRAKSELPEMIAKIDAELQPLGYHIVKMRKKRLIQVPKSTSQHHKSVQSAPSTPGASGRSSPLKP